MTEKIFYKDAASVSFDAVVLSCTQEQEHYWIELDRTAFFPEEGGQYADTGTLNREPVLDVKIRQDVIYHKMSRPLALHSAVSGLVDWDSRFDNMQQHTGEHIISGLVHRHFGYDNVGFHLGREAVTLDFNGVLTQEELRRIEREANEAVFANLAVRISYPSPAELSSIDYRSKLALEKDVRIVEIPGYDICACCAPHVGHTGEIGLIKITGVMKHRGGVRVNILCGLRALQDYGEKTDSVSCVSAQLSAPPEAVADAVARLKSENAALHARLCDMQAQMMQYKIASLPDTLHHVFFFESDLDTPAMRKTVNALTQRFEGYCGVFVGSDAVGYRYIIGSRTLDSRIASGWLQEGLSSRGGGSSAMVQGSLTASRQDIQSLFAAYSIIAGLY